MQIFSVISHWCLQVCDFWTAQFLILDYTKLVGLHAKIRPELLLITGYLFDYINVECCLLYTSPSPRDRTRSRMPSSA